MFLVMIVKENQSFQLEYLENTIMIIWSYYILKEKVDINRREGNVIKAIPVQKKHYVYIKDFNRLMFSFTKHGHKKHFCMHCLQCFYSNDDLENHKMDCIVINGVQAIELQKTYIEKNGQERTPSVYFHNHQKQ